MKRFTAFLLAALLLACTLTAQAATPYRTFTLGVDGDLVETQTAYEPVRAMTRFGEETLKNPADLRMGPDGNLYIADFSFNAIAKVTPNGKVTRIAQSPDNDGLDGGLDQPGEPIVWNGKIVASCFDLVTDPGKVNNEHTMPATLAYLEM